MLFSFALADRDAAVSITCKISEKREKNLHLQKEWYSDCQVVQKSMNSKGLQAKIRRC
jgi:hypothetical protein